MTIGNVFHQTKCVVYCLYKISFHSNLKNALEWEREQSGRGRKWEEEQSRRGRGGDKSKPNTVTMNRIQVIRFYPDV